MNFFFQVYESLNENQGRNLEGKESQEEPQIREVLSDTETDLQLVSDKMEELNVMKVRVDGENYRKNLFFKQRI